MIEKYRIIKLRTLLKCCIYCVLVTSIALFSISSNAGPDVWESNTKVRIVQKVALSIEIFIDGNKCFNYWSFEKEEIYENNIKSEIFNNIKQNFADKLNKKGFKIFDSHRKTELDDHIDIRVKLKFFTIGKLPKCALIGSYDYRTEDESKRFVLGRHVFRPITYEVKSDFDKNINIISDIVDENLIDNFTDHLRKRKIQPE